MLHTFGDGYRHLFLRTAEKNVAVIPQNFLFLARSDKKENLCGMTALLFRAVTKMGCAKFFAGLISRPSLLISLLHIALSHPASAASFNDRIKLIDPPLSAPALVFEDSHQTQHSLADDRGRFVLLNIWATWCAPCRHEMPSLSALQSDLAATHVLVLPLSEDRDATSVSAFFSELHLTNLLVAVDLAGRAPSVLKLEGLPATLLINPQGQIVARLDGMADWDSAEAQAFIRSFIDQPAVRKIMDRQ